MASPTPASATGPAVQVISGAQYGFDQPNSISADGTDVWVTNPGNNTVTEFSEATGAFVQVVSGSQFKFNDPTAILSDGTHVWVVNHAGASVTELSAATGALVQVLSATLANSQPEFYAPDGIVESGGSVWVSNSGPVVVGSTLEGMVTELSASSGALVQVVDNPGSGGAEASLTADASDIWVTNSDGSSVSEFSSATGALVQVISGAQYGFSSVAAITNDGTNVWVMSDGGDGYTTELSAATGAFIQTINIVFGGGAYEMVDNGTDVWATDNGDVYEWSSSTGDPVATLSGAPFDFAVAFGITLSDGEAWVTNTNGNTVTEFSTAAAALTAQTITFTAPTTGTIGSTSSLTPTASSGLTIALSVDPSTTNGACTLTGDTVNYVSDGTCVLDANQVGNTTYAAAPQVQQTIVVSAVALIAQAPLTITTLTGTFGTSLDLATSGGSGTGVVTFVTTDGTATGCQVAGSTLTSSTAGTCSVTATKATDTTYLAVSSAPTTITLNAKVTPPPAKPAPVSVTFSGKGWTLSQADKKALDALAKKLESGASVTCTGYAHHDHALAALRAHLVTKFLSSLVRLHATLRIVTTFSFNRATVVTTKQ